MENINKHIYFTASNGDIYKVPVEKIANNRAKYYAKEYVDGFSSEDLLWGKHIIKSLDEDTIPLFNDNAYEVVDWAKNNMDWGDIKCWAELVQTDIIEPDLHNDWIESEFDIR